MSSRRFVISVDSCRPGMRTAEAIFNQYGAVILFENTILDEHAIDHLRNMGIQYIPVYEESMLSVSGMDKDWAITDDGFGFNVKYEQDVHTIKKTLTDISSGKRLNREITDQIVHTMVGRPQQNRHMVDAVMQVRRIDEYTYYHCMNVAMLSMTIARWMNFDDAMVRRCTEAGLLHDVGKARIPVEIINKPGKLTDSEFEEMKRHSEYGYMIVTQDRRIDHNVAVAILTHHEKMDGSGYPLGLTGDKINQIARIVAVADIFDAMTANRVYKYKDTPFKVFELMQHNSLGVLDPLVLNAFLSNMTHYYIGSKVRLSTGETAEVVFMNRLDFSRPVVMVGDRFIDLAVTKSVSIVEFL
jgi:putative nucleotidyltransferase with HDIG domain